MPLPDSPHAEIPGITRPYTTDEVLHSALHILNEVETVLTHLTDPETQQAITIAMRDHAHDHSGFGGLIDWVQLTALTVSNHLNNK